MKNRIIILLTIIYSAVGYAQIIPQRVIDIIDSKTSMNDGACRVDIDNKDYFVTIEANKITSIRRVVFPNNIRQAVDTVLINMLEEAYATKLLKIINPRFDDIKLIKGSWSLLEKISDNAEYSISYIDFADIIISLKLDTDSFVVKVPINYQKFNAGSRNEIEERFISDLKAYPFNGNRPIPQFTCGDLVKVGEHMYSLKKGLHLMNSINQDSYLYITDNGNCDFIINPEQPVATISNMIVVGVGYLANLNLSILRHEYGQKTNINLPLEQFLQYCISTGCKIYWGYDRTEGDSLFGTIFCHNETQGYEHIVRIQCDVSQLGDDSFEMIGRASVFIPTTNTSNIFENE